MMNHFLFLLLILILNGVKSAEIPENDADMARSKRTNEEISEEPKTKKPREHDIVQCFKIVASNFTIKRIPPYEDDPNMRFVDKLLRRSFGLKIVEMGDESLWEMSFLKDLTLDWHTGAFFLVLSNNCQIDEETVVEYFKFIHSYWTDENLRVTALRKSIQWAIDKFYLELFEVILEVIDKEACVDFDGIGLEVLLLLKMKQFVTLRTRKEEAIWYLMCAKTVKMFPEAVYDLKLRIVDFKGSTFPRTEIFIHLSPILRNLLIETREEFDSQQDPFDFFVLFNLGDLEAKLPMGVGGLRLINQMFLRSRINLSAFKSSESIALKKDLIERIFDALFLGQKMSEMIKILFDYGAFSIFESFLKYSKDFRWNEAKLCDILNHFIFKTTRYTDYNFIFALIAYVNIPKTVWEKLRAAYSRRESRLSIVNLSETLSEVLKIFGSNLNLRGDRTIDLQNIDSNLIQSIPELQSSKRPVQLEAGRIFLARVCGVPLEMTEVFEYCAENYEWSEAVGFINFYVERVANIIGYPGIFIKFKACD